jgi:RNA polymerase sigma-70 factor (ECF subfamily)
VGLASRSAKLSGGVVTRGRSDAGSAPPLDEGELLVRHRGGDAQAFAEFVGRYRRPVYGYLVRCGVADGARDDVFQEIFTSIHGAVATYQAERPVRPWVFAIVANAVRSYHRAARVRALAVATPDTEPRDPVAPDGQQIAEARETAAWIEQAIAALPAAQREVVALCCIEQLAQDDVAAALAMPVNTVKTHLRRARVTLARALARRQAALRREVSA